MLYFARKGMRANRMDQLSTDRINASESKGGAQRTAPRDSLLLTAGFRVKGSDQVEQVRIRNLSAGGLMAEVEDDIDRDTEVEVQVRGIGWISGRIAWQAMGRVGIAFDREVDPKKARKPVGGGAKTPTRAKLKL
jgi:hypothetical protein